MLTRRTCARCLPTPFALLQYGPAAHLEHSLHEEEEHGGSEGGHGAEH